jgi:c-di-GMP-binding flagellar brake protein YcgR
MEERRRFVRLDTRLEVRYTVLPTGSAQQTVSNNIGGGGICFFADKPLAAGTYLQVAMKLPGREQPVPFTAEVVWSELYEVVGKIERRQAVEVGVRFLEIAPSDLEAIMQHVILSFKSPQPSA